MAFSSQQIKDFREAFDVFDADGSGDIDVKEIAEAMKALGAETSEDELKTLIAEVDTDGGGSIDFDEFCALMGNLKKLDKKWEALLSFSKAQVEEYRDAFNMFDKDGSGDIDLDELATLLQNLGVKPSEAELKTMISEIDADGSGSIEFEEFLQLMTKQAVGGPSKEDDIAEAFKAYDRKSQGFITVEDLQAMMTSLGEKFSNEDIQEMLLEVDHDGDGKVGYNDFLKMMTVA
mmetsp:Transcript_1076/g.2183  ORF Transcript_1076/g.2183 Transcript_1076/m.2183 type:complete len:233 (-) Transcript_1076:60-758(-)